MPEREIADMPRLFFMHIPKTAGTAFTEFFRQRITPNTDVDLGYADRAERLAQAAFARGHLTLGAFREMPASSLFKIVTVIRNPFERLASHLQYLDRYNRKPYSKHYVRLPAAVDKVAKTDLSDPWDIARYIDEAPPFGRVATINNYVQVLTDTVRGPHFLPVPVTDHTERTDQALANLNEIDFVLVADELDRGVNTLAKELGLEGGLTPRTNLGTYGRRVDPNVPAFREATERFLRGDLRIYEEARRIAL